MSNNNLYSKNFKGECLTQLKKESWPTSTTLLGKGPPTSKLTGSLCGSEGSTSHGSKPRLIARDSKVGDESAGYGGSTCSGGKTTSSPDKKDVNGGKGG